MFQIRRKHLEVVIIIYIYIYNQLGYHYNSILISGSRNVVLPMLGQAVLEKYLYYKSVKVTRQI